MNILILGSGAREYAIGSVLKKDNNVSKLFFSPGNGAMVRLGENVKTGSYEELIGFAKEQAVELVIIGPEQPLVEGAADLFRDAGFWVFGPSKQAAQLEASKSFMKDFVSRHGIKTAAYLETTSKEEATAFIETMQIPIVVKADGLCAGKGVIIAQSHEEAIRTVDEMLSGEAFGGAGEKVVIEEYLDGYELSVFAISDGESYIVLPPCQDHKRLKDNDEGPNTGGMGAYAPTALCDKVLLDEISSSIVKPAIEGAKKDGFPFEGVLFCGIMVVNGEPYLLEFNVRFGDPECEVLMLLLKSSALELFDKAAKKELDKLEVAFHDKHAMCVVAASKDYPYKGSIPQEITEVSVPPGLEAVSDIFYAGVKEENGKLLASGGRVLCSVGIGDTLAQAKDVAYKRLDSVKFEGMQYRKDIGSRAL